MRSRCRHHAGNPDQTGIPGFLVDNGPTVTVLPDIAPNGIHSTMDPEATQVLTWTGEFASIEDPIPQWEAEARDRLRTALDHLTKPLEDLVARDANEGDTRLLITDFLSEGLGYNKYDEVTTEYRTKNDAVDYGLKVGDETFALVEAKRCGQDLNARSLRPARISAAAEGIKWLVLTNGRAWQVYHAETAEETPLLVLEVDLLGEADAKAKVDALFHLSRAAVANGRLDTLLKWRQTLAGAPLAEVVQSPTVVEAIRSEVRRLTGHVGHVGDFDDVLRALREEVIPQRLLED